MNFHIEERERIFSDLRRDAHEKGRLSLIEDAYRIHCVKDAEIASRGLKRRPMSLESKFYTYALLDPRIQGNFCYLVYGEKLEFKFQPFYIGKGNKRRKNAHSEMARRNPEPVKGEHKGNIIRELHRAGLEPIVVQLSGFEIEGMSLAREIEAIAAIGRDNTGNGPLANMTDGGEGASGSIPTEAWRESIMKANVGRKKSEDERRRLSEALTGRKFSQETIRKMRESAEKRVRLPHSEETKTKISAAHSGKKKSEEHRKNISEAAKNRVRKPHSEETKAKMREARRNRPPISDETKAKIKATLTGRKMSDEARENMRIAQLARQEALRSN